MLAFVQDDIKKVLAYSTISQLGYMVMALGVGAWVAAVFHLFTHAFFKALLFLGAGSVSHSGSHHSFDMKEDMGGLRKYMPITFWTFMIGTLALAGIFPFAGFWSKDEILVTAGESRASTSFLVVGLIGAFLTAAYMTRCVYLTFFGEYRGHGHPHESEPAITVPLIILAVFSILAGFLNAAPFHIEKFTEWVEPTVAVPRARPPRVRLPDGDHLVVDRGARHRHRRVLLVPARGARRRSRASRSATRLAHAGYTFLENKYYLDDLYEDVIVGVDQGPDRAGVVLVQPARHRRCRQRRRRRAPGSSGGSPTTCSTRRASTARSTASPRSPARRGGLLRYVQSGRVQRYALLLFAAVGLLSLALLHRQHLI